ncbi:MAG: 2-C-methyl-D-erythritol 4-phosphate cytidylyltransferase [Bacteroidales bacterium]|jgi:2-C-methyl-D-erythritol 4-phosphate cytidylyltransferase|nr:2-C-methyl-D-erythritol 4-phosphate cytidylyltransferase [Bacteroidales bacterium]
MQCSSSKAVIIVAGGVGKRFAADLPKQYLTLRSRPILIRTLEVVRKSVPNATIVVVIAKEMFAFWQELCAEYNCNVEHILAEAGKERFFSVLSGLKVLENKNIDLVAIHDGVRCLVTEEIFENCFKSAEGFGAVVCACKSIDSVRYRNEAVNRNEIFLVQTPQCFKYEIIKKAYETPFKESFTDDASVVEANGEKIHIIEGSRENIKITTPFDLKIAECILDEREY